MTESGLIGLQAGALSREQLHAAITQSERPLVSDYMDLEAQLQPNGIDLTLAQVSRHAGIGQIGTSNDTRILPDLIPLAFDAEGWLTLGPGAYHILFNEVVALPPTLMALGRPRSSLGRSGVTIHTAVWDAGYTGRSTSLLSVLNPHGFRVQQNARVMQLVFFGMAASPGQGYSGRYQNENVSRDR